MIPTLKKIDISTEQTVLEDVRTSRKKFRMPKKIITFMIVVFALVIGIGCITFITMRGVLAQARVTAAKGEELMTAVKGQDLVLAKSTLAQTRQELEKLNTQYNKVLYMRYIPLVGHYVSDGQHAISAGLAAVGAGEKAIEALEPNADLLGLKGESKFVYGSADERIQTAVQTMSALTPKINEMAQYIDQLRQEIAAIDPSWYPKKFRNVALREQLVNAKDVIENAANLFVNAQPLLVNLPSMLGEPDEKRYLVLFQNDKELRATGGFLTAYAQFRFVKGKAILEKADDIYNLDNSLRQKFPATREISTFHKNVYSLYIRDSNLSPDYKLSMQQFEKMYNTSSSKEIIDGIIAVDTHVLVEALRILGPMYVYGREFSADIDKRCDCPKAVYELEDYSTRPVNYVREARKDIIGVLLQGILQKALGVSPSQYWGQLFQMLISEINQKHVLTYFRDDKAQFAAESFNMAGRIMTASESATLLSYKAEEGWDYLHINNSNMAGAKANMFVSSKVTKDTVRDGDTLKTTLTVEYKNPYPGSDCGLESGGLCLNAPLRNWVRVYVPAGSTLSDSKGSQSPKDNKPVPMDVYDELAKTVFEGFLIVNPMGTARLEIKYETPFSGQYPYQLLIQKQPGTDGEEYLIRFGGKDRKKFILQTDTEIVL